MKIIILSVLRRILPVALTLLLLTATGFAMGHQTDETTTADVKREAAETYETLKKFTVEQRDEATAYAEKKLDQIDRRIEKLQRKADKQWNSASAEVRQETREALDALREMRENVATWYGGLKYTSAEAWDEVKQGFADSYDRLIKGFDRAADAFERKN